MMPQASYPEPGQEMPPPPAEQMGEARLEPHYAPYRYQYGPYDEQFIDALVSRLGPRLANRSRTPSSGQRLALAIVSLALMVPLMGILFAPPTIATFGLWGTLFGLAIVCVTMISVNNIYAISGTWSRPNQPEMLVK